MSKMRRAALVRLREADLRDILQLPEGTKLMGIYFNYERNTLDFVLECDAFPEIDQGAILPEAPAIILKDYVERDGHWYLNSVCFRIEWPLREDHMLPPGVHST